MDLRTYICLFDLKAYDDVVAPALRQYTRDYDPAGVVTVLETLAGRDPAGDFKHWIDSIRPDKGYKPSEQTVQELCNIVIPGACLPSEPGFHPMQDADILLPWLGQHSEWFVDLMDNGEELAGGRLEFGFGNGRLVATREQISQFQDEVQHLATPDGPFAKLAGDFVNLRRILDRAAAQKNYTLFKTSMESNKPSEQ